MRVVVAFGIPSAFFSHSFRIPCGMFSECLKNANGNNQGIKGETGAFLDNLFISL